MAYYYGPYRDLPAKLTKRADDLTKVLAADRLKPDDVEGAAKALGEAAAALEQLMKGELPGCLCTVVDNDNYTYLSYNETCPHHRSLWVQREESKKLLDASHKKLTNDLRIKLVSELIGGLARGDGQGAQHVVQRALELADEAIRQLGA